MLFAEANVLFAGANVCSSECARPCTVHMDRTELCIGPSCACAQPRLTLILTWCMPYVVTESIKRKPELAVGHEAHLHAHNPALQNQASRRKMRQT